MNKSIITELIFSTTILFLIGLLFNPFKIWMPMTIHLIIVGALSIVFLILSLFVVKKIKEDEREQQIRLFSYKAAYISVSAILVTGIIIQSFNHKIDPWLVSALGLMLGFKLATLIMRHY